MKKLSQTLTSKIKRGCSEFPATFPEFGKLGKGQEDTMKYPKAWRAIENSFDEKNSYPQKQVLHSSLTDFCLSDFLIIQKWIDYAKGLNDPTAKLFKDVEIVYKEVFEIAAIRCGM